MSASALLAQLKEAGVSFEAEGGNLRLKGPKAALGNEVLTELRANKAELLNALRISPAPARSRQGATAAWRAAIGSVGTNQVHIAKLKTLSLRFLDSHDAIAAVACGWDAVSLFGVHRGPAPHERLDAWGLIPAQVWGVLRCSIEHFDCDVCLLRTPRGATLRQPRLRANFDHAVAWWMHQSIANRIDEKGADLTFEVEKRAAIIAEGCGVSQVEAIERAAREFGFASALAFREASKRKPANPWGMMKLNPEWNSFEAFGKSLEKTSKARSMQRHSSLLKGE